MGLYKKRPTLSELLTEIPTLLGLIDIPSTLSNETLTAIIKQELGELETIFINATAAANFLPYWSANKLPGWTKILAALTASYNPLHNYERTDTESESVNETTSEQGSGSRTTGTESEYSNSVENGGTDETEHSVQGFNSATYQPDAKDVITHGATQSGEGAASSSGSETSTDSKSGTRGVVRTHQLSSEGNIGVTTSQQMLEAEIVARRNNAMYTLICEDFKKDLCVGVW